MRLSAGGFFHGGGWGSYRSSIRRTISSHQREELIPWSQAAMNPLRAARVDSSQP